MTDHDREERPTAEVLLEYVRTIVHADGASEVIEALNEFCTRYLGVYGVGILLVTDSGSLEVGSANTDAGQTVEQAEAELEEGPCTDAARSGQVVVVPDLTLERVRWPRFVPRAEEAGIRAIHAIPIHHAGHLIGALDIISDEPGELPRHAVSTAQLLVEVAAAYIANSQALADQSRLAQQLQTALESRSIIEQAKGIISVQHQVDVDEAFDRIRRYARSSQRKLKDVARELVERQLELPTP